MIQSLLRPVRTFLALLPFVVSFLRDWRGLILWGAPRRLTASQHKDRAKRLTAVLASLGPAFIKGAQVLATREDILPRVYTRELKTLQDRVPPFPAREARHVLRASLGKSLGSVFESFDPNPLAAASLGQVHRAVHHGKPVAVKILRPGVERIVAIDLGVVSFLIAIAETLTDNQFVRNLRTVHREFERMIAQEMDFRNEQKNADRLRENFKNDPRVRIPLCVEGLTTRRTCVFEFVDGVRVDDTAAIESVGMTPKRLIETMIEVYVRMTIVHGFVHADPHPGNLMVDRDGKLVILDYGMCLEFGDEVRLPLLRACLAVVRRDIDTIVDCFYELKMVNPDVNRALVRDAGQTLLSIQLRDDFNPRMVQEIADDILATFHRFPVRMPQQLVYVFRASALVEGLGIIHDPNFSAVRSATPVIKKMMREIALEPRFSAVEQGKRIVKDTLETVRYLHRVIVRLEREEQRVRLDPRDLTLLQDHWSALARRRLLGGAALGLAGAGFLAWLVKGAVVIPVLMVVAGLAGFALIVALPTRAGRG